MKILVQNILYKVRLSSDFNEILVSINIIYHLLNQLYSLR